MQQEFSYNSHLRDANCNVQSGMALSKRFSNCSFRLPTIFTNEELAKQQFLFSIADARDYVLILSDDRDYEHFSFQNFGPL